MKIKSKKSLAACLCMFGISLLTACAKGNSSFTEDAKAMEKAAGSVVKLEVYDSGGKRLSVGSSFCVQDGNMLITAEHVIEDMDYAIATDDSGETYRIEEVLVKDDDTDLALCKLPEGKTLPILKIKTDLPNRGESVACIGSSAGFVNLISLGNVSGIWEAKEQNRILFTAPVSGGNSGGPLLDDTGQVIGVVIGSYDRVDGMYIAVSSESVKKLLEHIN